MCGIFLVLSITLSGMDRFSNNLAEMFTLMRWSVAHKNQVCMSKVKVKASIFQKSFLSLNIWYVETSCGPLQRFFELSPRGSKMALSQGPHSLMKMSKVHYIDYLNYAHGVKRVTCFVQLLKLQNLEP